MDNIVFKKRYTPTTGDENNIYKTLSELPQRQDLDNFRHELNVLEECAFWVILGLGIGEISLALYILLFVPIGG